MAATTLAEQPRTSAPVPSAPARAPWSTAYTRHFIVIAEIPSMALTIFYAIYILFCCMCRSAWKLRLYCFIVAAGQLLPPAVHPSIHPALQPPVRVYQYGKHDAWPKRVFLHKGLSNKSEVMGFWFAFAFQVYSVAFAIFSSVFGSIHRV